MQAAQAYKRVVLYLFRLLGKPQPTIEPESVVRLKLKCGVSTDIQLLDEHVAFSASIKLSTSPSTDLLLELLQANLDVTNNPAITVAAVVQTQEVVVWCKQHLGQTTESQVVDLYDRFAHCVEAVQQCILRSDPSGGRSRRPPVTSPFQQPRATHLHPSSIG